MRYPENVAARNQSLAYVDLATYAKMIHKCYIPWTSVIFFFTDMANKSDGQDSLFSAEMMKHCSFES